MGDIRRRSPREAQPGIESAYEHFERDDVVAEYASFDFLLPPEQVILEQLAQRLTTARMLDVGVGAGRTTVHFAPPAAHYVGLDVSTPMVHACRRRFVPASPGLQPDFAVADVRGLPFAGGIFDLVLFSFNSLDVVGDHGERLQALREIHRVCRPGGVFCFSAHNLCFAEARFSLPAILRQLVRSDALRTRPLALLRRPRRLASLFRQPLRWRRLNSPTRRLVGRGHSMIVEERQRYELVKDFYAHPHETIQVEMYYTRPQAQIGQLAEIGFEHTRVFAPDGEEVTDRTYEGLSQHWWLYYLCAKRTKPRPRGA